LGVEFRNAAPNLHNLKTNQELTMNTVPIDSDVMAIAQQAFAAQQRGVATGDWADFLALLSEDIELHAPSPHIPNGAAFGKAEVAELLQKFSTELNLRAEVTPVGAMFFNQTDTIAVEYSAKGQVGR
jgi:ketosteroid isomerase-like protein